MTIEITNESVVEVDETVLLRLTEHNLAELHVSADADIAILLVDEGAMEALHVQWMDEPGPADRKTGLPSSLGVPVFSGSPQVGISLSASDGGNHEEHPAAGSR